jgi:hypothetical protein
LIRLRSTNIGLAGFAVMFSGLAPLSGQSYTVFTIAGGGQQSNVLATSPYVAVRVLNYLAVDRNGNLFFGSDSQVLRLDPSTGIVTVVAGSNSPGFGGDGGPVLSAQLSNPQGLTFDTAGNLYIADTGNRRIRKITNGIVTTIAGNGSKGYGGNDGSAVNAQFDSPSGVRVDPAGNLYIADGGNNLVRRISNGIISAFAGNGTQGYSGDGGPRRRRTTWRHLVAVRGRTSAALQCHGRTGKFPGAVGVVWSNASGALPALNGQSGPPVPIKLASFAPGIFKHELAGIGTGRRSRLGVPSGRRIPSRARRSTLLYNQHAYGHGRRCAGACSLFGPNPRGGRIVSGKRAGASGVWQRRCGSSVNRNRRATSNAATIAVQ